MSYDHWLTTHTHTRLTALFSGLPGWAGTRKVKQIWILLKQETVSGSGISWAICKSAPRSSTTPLSFLQARCPSCHPTNSVKALKARSLTYRQSIFKRYHSDKHFLEFYLQDGGKINWHTDYTWNKITSLSPNAYALLPCRYVQICRHSQHRKYICQYYFCKNSFIPRCVFHFSVIVNFSVWFVFLVFFCSFFNTCVFFCHSLLLLIKRYHHHIMYCCCSSAATSRRHCMFQSSYSSP